MAVEIEKKYRLTADQREQVLASLNEQGAKFCGEDFEENTLFTGGILSLKPCILRLRRIGDKAILTYKEKQPSNTYTDMGIKRRIEHETEIQDGETMNKILHSLGYQPSLVYEKRRQSWHLGEVEIVVDELPFGFYMEIEGSEDSIQWAEKALTLQDFVIEHEPYPNLTLHFGKRNGSITEARFT